MYIRILIFMFELGVWSLRASESSEFDKYLVHSFLGETRILAIENEQLEELTIPGFCESESSLFCANMSGNTLVQITATAVRLVSAETHELLFHYNPPNGQTISVATANMQQVVLAISDGGLTYLET